MKPLAQGFAMRTLAVLTAFALALVLGLGSARADDAGDAAVGTPDSAPGVDDSGAGGLDAASDVTPLACDGALCDTTNSAACSVGSRHPGRHLPGAAWLAPLGVAFFAAIAARRARRARSVFLAGAPMIAAMIATTGGASAAEPPPSAPVDVVVREAPPPQRFLVLAWNPLPLFTLGKVSGDLVLAPVDHHALVLSPFYASTTTKPVFVFDNGGNATLLPVQKFTGFGGEIGYRYYAGQGGPRGFFLGPSFMAGSFTATAQNGTQTSYLDYGIAADAGYEALVADHVALSAGLGVQYNFTSKSIPNQQFPAEVYANNGVRPRLLLSLGWAF